MVNSFKRFCPKIWVLRNISPFLILSLLVGFRLKWKVSGGTGDFHYKSVPFLEFRNLTNVLSTFHPSISVLLHFSHIIPNSLNSLVETYNITFTRQSQGSEWMECLQVFFSNSLFLSPRCLFPFLTHLSSVSPLDVTIVFSDKLSPKNWDSLLLNITFIFSDKLILFP